MHAGARAAQIESNVATRSVRFMGASSCRTERERKRAYCRPWAHGKGIGRRLGSSNFSSAALRDAGQQVLVERAIGVVSVFPAEIAARAAVVHVLGPRAHDL